MSGKLRLEVQTVELVSVIEAALETVRLSAETKGIQILKVLNPDAGPIKGDPTRLQQAVWNVLSNAVKFTPRGGKVQVLLERINSHVEISVSDTGMGIAPDFLPHVFERFRQADSSTSRRHGGLGLGLAIVKQIVELHGGTVAVFSEGEGRGTTFHIRLPVSVVRHADISEREPRAAASVPSAKLAGVRILVADDDPGTVDILRRMLSLLEAEVDTVGSGDEALERMKKSVPDLLLCDIGMPGMDGYEVIRRVRSAGHALPAIAVTAFARSEDRIRALEAGYNMHLSKPVETRELLTVVTSLMRSNAVS
jgi:CheY-like chemotaxis protein